jgi:NAD(P)-dependent dehydrogenase (short-subunit alcohol dehydrogenase family)
METRVALVTGASRGIGRAIAVELARAGFAVGVNYVHRRDQAAETVATITAAGGEAAALPADVADPQAVAALFAALDRHFGRLDALVNNAGIGTRIEALTAIDDAT